MYVWEMDRSWLGFGVLRLNNIWSHTKTGMDFWRCAIIVALGCCVIYWFIVPSAPRWNIRLSRNIATRSQPMPPPPWLNVLLSRIVLVQVGTRLDRKLAWQEVVLFVGVLCAGNIWGHIRTGTDLCQRALTVAPLGYQVASTMTRSPTQLHYPNTELTNPCPIMMAHVISQWINCLSVVVFTS